MQNIDAYILDGTPPDVIARYKGLAELAQASDFGRLDSNVVIIDTETTGLSFSHDELIQIAAARIEHGQISDWYVTFVNPGQFLTEDIVQLTHIHDEDLIDAPSPDEALAGLVDFVGDALLVAHNAAFDRHFCTNHPSGYPLLENIWLDSLEISRIALPRLKSHRLLDLVHAFGAPASTHRADDDVAATCVVYRILLAAIASMPPALVAHIGSMAPLEEWPTGFAFSEMALLEASPSCHAERSEGSPAPRHPESSEGSPSPCHSERSEGSLSSCHSERSEGSLSSCHSERSEGSPRSGYPDSPLRGDPSPSAQDDNNVEAQDGNNVAPRDGSGAMPRDGSGAMPRDGSGAMPRDGSGAMPRDGSGAMPRDGSGAAPWDGNPERSNEAKANPLFSVRAMRQRRVLSLPARQARKDADDLVGQLVFPSQDEIDDAFSSQGVLGRIYDDYEPRDEQRCMARGIRTAFATSENLVVEAGTGVGKSMAYLVPAALFARANGVSIGVATKTNSLLDQLVYQELPALSRALQEAKGLQPPNNARAGSANASEACEAGSCNGGASGAANGNGNAANPNDNAGSSTNGNNHAIDELTWAPLKGMSHYPCLRKIARLVDQGPAMREVAGKPVNQAPALAATLSYVEQSEYDDLDSLKIDYRLLPRYALTCTSSECLRRKCPFFGKLCFVHGARRRAETADIVVTNHSLLFCDLATDGGLLPPIRHWIVDEAHSAETEARQAFAQSVDSEALGRLANLVSDAGAGRNLFTRTERAVAKADGEQLVLLFGLLGKARTAGNAFAKTVADYQRRIKELLFFDPVKRTKRGPTYEQVDVWINDEVRESQVFADVASCANELIEASDRLIAACQDVVAYLEGIDEAAVAQREIASCTMELRELRNAAELVFSAAPANYAYQAALFRKKDRLTDRAEALLLDVGDKMNETLFVRTHSVVFTSATLTVGGSFDSFNQAMGLNRGEFSQAQTLELPSSYDFDNNMIVYVVSDMPDPNDPAYLQELNRLLVATHLAQRGSMLTLFTNRREMERCYEAVQPDLKRADLRLICQRYGVSVKGLRDDFLADEHLSLFALKSFWEGFDAPGATLKGVIIPKLPFARPTDPLYCERASRDDRAWWHYVLPQAVIETKQAAGRLIRKADDHGVLILADQRLLSKRYGKTFLRSLQSKTVRVRTIDEITQALSLMAGW